MEETHKKILQRNRISLVRDLDPSKLYDGLFEKGVFTQDMIDEIKVRQTCVSWYRGSSPSYVVSMGKLHHSECNSRNTACGCLRAMGPGGSRLGSWSGTWRPVGVEPFPYFWSAFGKQVSTVWHSSYRTGLQQSSYSRRHPLRWCILFSSLFQCVSLRYFDIFLEN